MGLYRHSARPHRLRKWTLARIRYRRAGLRRRTLCQFTRRRRRGKAYPAAARLGRRRRTEYAFAPHWSVRLEYLYSQFGRADIRFPSGAQYNSSLDFHSLRIGLNRKVDWPGKQLDTQDRSDRSRIRPLGNSRPDHLSAAGLSGIPCALHRTEQPDARAAGPGDLEQQSVPERKAVGRRRCLLQSRTAAGIWPERHGGRRRASPTARRRSPTSPTRITIHRGCFCGRPLASAASRRSLPAGRPNLAARWMFPG